MFNKSCCYTAEMADRSSDGISAM